jgi:hypothetical protein
VPPFKAFEYVIQSAPQMSRQRADPRRRHQESVKSRRHVDAAWSRALSFPGTTAADPVLQPARGARSDRSAGESLSARQRPGDPGVHAEASTEDSVSGRGTAAEPGVDGLRVPPVVAVS